MKMSEHGASGAPATKGGTSFLKIVLGVVAGGCLLVILGAVAVVLIIGTAAKKAREKAEKERARVAEMAVSEIPWQEIEEIFGPASRETGVRKEEAWKRYRGKKIRWTGHVLAVNELLGTHTMQVRIHPDATLRTILVSDAFVALQDGEEQKARAFDLKKQETVTFEGVLDRQSVKIGHRWAVVTVAHGTIVD